MGTINGRSQLATDPVRNFRFLVTFLPQNGELKGVSFKPTVGFTSVSGLSMTTESIPYREGGYNTSMHQIPGQTSFSPITLQRGMILGTRQNWDWMRTLYRVVNASNTAGSNTIYGAQGRGDANFRCDLEIAVLDHPQAGSAAGNTGFETNAAKDDNVAQRFKVYNAWPTSLAFSDLNAGDNALLVEQMTLVHEGFDIQFATAQNKTAPKFVY